MDSPMMLVTQLHQVVEIGRPTVDPMPDVVHVGELHVSAARKTAALVTPPDDDALGVGGVAPGSAPGGTAGPTDGVWPGAEVGGTGNPPRVAGDICCGVTP